MSVCLESGSAKRQSLRLKWKTVCSSTSPLNGQASAIVEFNLWLMHSSEVDSPDPKRKLRKSKFPGCTAARGQDRTETLTFRQKKKTKMWWVRGSLEAKSILGCVKV